MLESVDDAVVQTSSVRDKVEQIAESKGFIRNERDTRQLKKTLAIKLLCERHGYKSVVGILNVSLGAICGWKQMYESSGLSGLEPKHQGKDGVLSASEKTALLAWLKVEDIWMLEGSEEPLSYGALDLLNKRVLFEAYAAWEHRQYPRLPQVLESPISTATPIATVRRCKLPQSA